MTAGSYGNFATILALGMGALIGMGIGFYANGTNGLLWGAAIGAFAGFWVRGSQLKDSEKERAMVNRPLTKEVKAEAEIERDENGTYLFAWMFKNPAGEIVGNTIPLDDFESFEFGALSDWFVGVHQKQDFHDTGVIVLQSSTYGIQCVAAHAGSKADLSNLHAVLTRHFILGRRALVRAGKALPVLSDDVPTVL